MAATAMPVAGQLPPIFRLRELPPDQLKAFLAGLSDADALSLLYTWRLWARPKQLPPPGRWQVWIPLGGRGAGKTRTGAEFVNAKAEAGSGQRGFLLGATFDDVRYTMIEGESGILSCARPDFRPRWWPGRKLLEYPNGAKVRCFSAEQFERLRGPQHYWGWTDELCAFKYPQEAWDQMMFGLRLGELPQVIVTTTPKPILLLMNLLKDAVQCWDLREALAGDPILERFIPVVVSTSTSYENRANVSEAWYEQTIAPYEGTRLGDQEILAKLLTDVPGALWKMTLLEENRIGRGLTLPDFNRVVVAIDPAVTMKKGSNETGIIVGARGLVDGTAHGYLLDDLSGRYSPDQWARLAVEAYHEHHADRIVAEQNQGGDMVESTIATVDPNVPVKLVTASRGKVTRAEPIAAKDEQHKIHHVGTFGALEAQLTTWVPDSGLPSPDRLDARVWCFTELLLGKQGAFVV